LGLAGRHRFGASVRLDGGAEVLNLLEVLDVIVSNSVWYGGRWVLDRRARPDDGLLELVAVRGWRDLLRHAWTDREPGGQADERGASIELVFDRPVPSQVDGEVGPTGRRFRIALELGALAVVRR
jgi:diacylglycerol kinase family enzyme